MWCLNIVAIVFKIPNQSTKYCVRATFFEELQGSSRGPI